MSEPLLLPPESAPGKPVWRRWKWIFLSIFGAVLVLRPWLPGIVIVLGWLCGIAALTNLAFLGARHLDVVVGDVSGKGISAALLMANLQAAMRNQLLQMRRGSDADFAKDLPELMSRLNRQIYDNSPSAKYVTLFLARYEAESQHLVYCNAGHLPPFVFRNGSVSRLETGGTVLGLFPTADFAAGSVELDPGSLVAIYMDGVTEAVNEHEEEFGEGRLLAALEEVRQFPPEAVYRHVSEQVRHWQGNLKQHDDITLIVARAG